MFQRLFHAFPWKSACCRQSASVWCVFVDYLSCVFPSFFRNMFIFTKTTTKNKSRLNRRLNPGIKTACFLRSSKIKHFFQVVPSKSEIDCCLSLLLSICFLFVFFLSCLLSLAFTLVFCYFFWCVLFFQCVFIFAVFFGAFSLNPYAPWCWNIYQHLP